MQSKQAPCAACLWLNGSIQSFECLSPDSNFPQSNDKKINEHEEAWHAHAAAFLRACRRRIG
ncbi:MAG: hypothetical protein V4633_19905, partial [Pseudomonadota bacterium]